MLEINRKRTYPCSVQNLWRAIATQEGLSGWLMPCDFQPVEGHEFTFRTKPAPGFDGIVHGKVLEVDEPRLLRLSWKSGRLETQVVFTIKKVDDSHSTLEVMHTGFGISSIFARIMLGFGWTKLMKSNLPMWLEGDSKGGDDQS